MIFSLIKLIYSDKGGSRMKKILSLLLIFSLALVITGCNKDSNQIIGIRGEIKEVYLDEENSLVLTFLIEGEIEDDTRYDSASVTVNNSTDIYRGEEKATIEDLEEGITVEVVFEFAVAESYPVQGTAKKIKILDD